MARRPTPALLVVLARVSLQPGETKSAPFTLKAKA
jgi:hypothetical protein